MSNGQLILLGNFSPSEADRLFNSFQSQKIECSCERDDSEIHQLSAERLLGSSFGTAAIMRVFVKADDLAKCQQIQKDLFGEGQV